MNDDLPHGTPAGPSQDEPLETALREHYLAIGPAQSARLRARISNALDRRSARRGSRLRLLPALAGLTAVAALAGVATAPLWLAPAAGPAGATSSAVEAPASAEPSLPQQTEGESAPLNWDRLQAAQADRLGRTAQGDLWFLRQSQTGASTLAISSDAGASWVPIVLDLPTSISADCFRARPAARLVDHHRRRND